MKIIVLKNAKLVAQKVAEIITKQVEEKPNATLGLATGGTFELVYKSLVQINKIKKLDWLNVKTFNLDEYVGLAPSHPMAYHYYMKEKLFNHLNFLKTNIHIPNGIANFEQETREYEAKIKQAKGINLQLLGIGENAHIGFNEPGSSQDSLTRVVSLNESTIKANARYFARLKDVPRQAITMGISTILKAQKIVLVGIGEKKAKAIYETIYSPISSRVPSSFLRDHKKFILVVDEKAYSLAKDHKEKN